MLSSLLDAHAVHVCFYYALGHFSVSHDVLCLGFLLIQRGRILDIVCYLLIGVNRDDFKFVRRVAEQVLDGREVTFALLLCSCEPTQRARHRLVALAYYSIHC